MKISNLSPFLSLIPAPFKVATVVLGLGLLLSFCFHVYDHFSKVAYEKKITKITQEAELLSKEKADAEALAQSQQLRIDELMKQELPTQTRKEMVLDREIFHAQNARKQTEADYLHLRQQPFMVELSNDLRADLRRLRNELNHLYPVQ